MLLVCIQLPSLLLALVILIMLIAVCISLWTIASLSSRGSCVSSSICSCKLFCECWCCCKKPHSCCNAELLLEVRSDRLEMFPGGWRVWRRHVASSQKEGPILVALNIRYRNIVYIPKGPIILITTHVLVPGSLAKVGVARCLGLSHSITSVPAL